MEALHAAAFRTGLGNSLYMGEHLVGSHSSDMLKAFVDAHYTSNNVAVIGLGVEHGALLNMVKNALTVGSGQAPPVPASQYFGGKDRYSLYEGSTD